MALGLTRPLKGIEYQNTLLEGKAWMKRKAVNLSAISQQLV
jgi:hypothetical protein